MTLSEVYSLSGIIVYGKVLQHFATKINGKYVIEAEYEVMCVLKRGDVLIQDTITISGIGNMDKCSGTPVKQLLRAGDHSILALKNMTADHSKYELDEPMVHTSAGVHALKPYFLTLSKICGIQTWEMPQGANESHCPICGISDFAPEVSTLDTNATVCNFYESSVVFNMTECDLYMDFPLDFANEQTCVPTTYTSTCMTIVYRYPTATCQCGDEKVAQGPPVSQGTSVASMLAVLVMSALVFMSV